MNTEFHRIQSNSDCSNNSIPESNIYNLIFRLFDIISVETGALPYVACGRWRTSARAFHFGFGAKGALSAPRTGPRRQSIVVADFITASAP